MTCETCGAKLNKNEPLCNCCRRINPYYILKRGILNADTQKIEFFGDNNPEKEKTYNIIHQIPKDRFLYDGTVMERIKSSLAHELAKHIIDDFDVNFSNFSDDPTDTRNVKISLSVTVKLPRIGKE